MDCVLGKNASGNAGVQGMCVAGRCRLLAFNGECFTGLLIVVLAVVNRERADGESIVHGRLLRADLEISRVLCTG